MLLTSRALFLTFCNFWRISSLTGSCSSRSSCSTCSRSWRALCLTCCLASRVSYSTCFRDSRALCLTCFVPQLSHVTCALHALMPHLPCTLSALVPAVPHLLQVSHGQQSSCISCVVALVSRTCFLCSCYYSYLRLFPTWTTINHNEKQLMLKESCYNYFLYER